MKKFIIPALLVLSIGTLIYFIPSIQKANKLDRLEKLQAEYAKCETVKMTTHSEANKIREELGLIKAGQPQVLSGSQPEGTQSKILSNQIIE